METTLIKPNVDHKNNSTLFHYCSTETFLSIVQNKCLWFSDINTMNDYGEMHWGYENFEIAAGQVMETVGREFLDKIDEILHKSQTVILPMICSLSTDGDVLSQWRAYADNGTGLALGMNSEKLAALSINMGGIEYDQNKQISCIRAAILAIHDVYNNMPDKDRNAFFFDECAKLSVDLNYFKNPAFSEEKEVRMVRAVNVIEEKGDWKLKDSGGTGERKSRKKLPVEFRSAKNGGIISYVKVPLTGLGNELFTEVILGPKSINNGREISMVLNAAGYKNCKIKKSTATLR